MSFEAANITGISKHVQRELEATTKRMLIQRNLYEEIKNNNSTEKNENDKKEILITSKPEVSTSKNKRKSRMNKRKPRVNKRETQVQTKLQLTLKIHQLK